jgi:hypothetical protein
MARTVFFSFHYQTDIWRINQIRNLPNIIGNAAAGFKDASLWEEAKSKSDDSIKQMIDRALEGTSVTVVFIGSKTAGRRFINYEVQRSIDRGNAVMGVQIHHLKDAQGNVDEPGNTPFLIVQKGYKVFKYVDSASLATWIENAALNR